MVSSNPETRRPQRSEDETPALSRPFWLAVAGMCATLFFLDLAVVESNRFLGQEVELRNHIFNAFYTALPFNALPFLHAVSLVGVVDHPYRVATALLAGFLTVGALGLLVLGRRGSAALLILSVIGPLLMANVMKEVIVRPGIQLGLGAHTFPSGHAAGSFAFFSITLYLLRGTIQNDRSARLPTVVVLLLGILTGLSSLTFHYPSEVLGGFALAGAWESLLIACLVGPLRAELPAFRL